MICLAYFLIANHKQEQVLYFSGGSRFSRDTAAFQKICLQKRNLGGGGAPLVVPSKNSAGVYYKLICITVQQFSKFGIAIFLYQVYNRESKC